MPKLKEETQENQGSKRSSIFDKLESAKNTEAFLSAHKQGDEDVMKPGLRWKDEKLKEYFHTRYFRHDQIDKDARLIQSEGYVQVEKSAAIMDVPFTDIFEDDQFEDDGVISSGDVMDKKHGKRIRENYLFLQPIGKHKALAHLRAQASKAHVSPRVKEAAFKKDAQEVAAASGFAGAVRVSQADIGGQDDVNSWDDM